MPLRVYNTLTRQKEDFQTIRPGKVGMYVCGPTVYKPSHVGHMVGPVIFDAVKRYLTYLGYQVTLVVNVTDIDDKIIKEAAVQKRDWKELAESVTADYLRNLQQLGVTGIDHFPRATEHVGEIVEKVEGVEDMNAHVLLGNPDVVIRPDSLQTARVGLTELDIESQLNAALYGQVASTVPEQDRMTKIRVRYPDRVRFDRGRLNLLPISLATATPAPAAARPAATVGMGFVPLGQLATIRTVRSPNELWRENQQPVITVSAELDKRNLRSVNRELQAIDKSG